MDFIDSIFLAAASHGIGCQLILCKTNYGAEVVSINRDIAIPNDLPLLTTEQTVS